MKILLGTHGVGKTTLLNEVHKHYPDYFITDGFSRPAIKVGRKLDLYEDEIQTIINEFTIWGYQNYLKHSKIISARSIIDAIVYTGGLNSTLFDDVDKMTDLFKSTVNEIEYIFYIPIEFDFVEDDIRDNQFRSIQTKIDTIIQKFIQDNIPPEKVITLTGTIEERFNQIKQYL